MLSRIRLWVDANVTTARVAAALLGLVFFLREFSDPDIWFHLTIGREIFSLWALPATEFYIFTADREPAHYPAAGYGLLQYMLFLLGGLPALAVFNAVIFLGTLYFLFQAGRSGCKTPGTAALFLAASIILWGLNSRFVFRPETILFIFMALELLLLERWLNTGRIRNLYALPVLAWAITLLHTTWVILVLILGAYATHFVIESYRVRHSSYPGENGKGLTHLLVTGGLMVLLPLANPYGLAQLEVLITSFSGDSSDLVEYLPIHSTEYFPHFVFLSFCVVMGWGLTRKFRICDVLMVVGFSILTFLAARNIALFAIACFLPIARALGEILSWSTQKWHRTAFGTIAAMLSVTAIGSEGNWGYGIRRASMPEAGANLIRTHLEPCNVFNFFHFGGYLIWELGAPFKVAIDGHFVTPSAARPLHDQFFRADPHWREIADSYEVCAIVTPATLSYSGALIPLVRRLAGDPHWHLVAAEGAGLTFFRSGLAPHVKTLPKHLIWEQVLRETTATLDRYPRQPQALDAARLARERLKMD